MEDVCSIVIICCGSSGDQHEYDRWDNDEFTMCGFTYETSRYAKFMGTKGELIVDMQPDEKESKIWIEHLIRREQKKLSMLQNCQKIFRDTAVEITGWWKNFWIL